MKVSASDKKVIERVLKNNGIEIVISHTRRGFTKSLSYDSFNKWWWTSYEGGFISVDSFDKAWRKFVK